MVADDDFELWLGRIGKDRPFRHQLRKALNQSGGAIRSSRTRGRRFDRSRIGRGSATGRILGTSNRHPGPRSRRVVVKARFVGLGGKRTDGAAAHLRYLQRDGTTRERERGRLYSAELDSADGKAFLERGSGDRHQFRFIVAAEDGAEYSDLKPMIRRLMAQAEKDLGTKLDWVAVDHFGSSALDYAREGTIVRISPTPVAVREADRIVSEIAAQHGGRYSEDLHYLHDPTTSERFVDAHVRRLEAMRRATGAVEREADGTWKIAPDHLERALQYERRRAEREPVRIEPLAAMALEQMPAHDGITRLEEDQSLARAGGAPGSFGGRVADAVRRRQQWLVEQGLADKTNMLDVVRRRELMRVAGQLGAAARLMFKKRFQRRRGRSARRYVSQLIELANCSSVKT